MEFRKTTEKEREIASILQAQAFHRRYDPGNRKKSETGRAVFDDEGRMVACLDLHDFNVWFDGCPVGMGGVGLVASLPEFRRSGHVRGLFVSVFEELYERDYVFSYLYPFSHTYYRKLGYEQSCHALGVTFSLEELLPFSRPGRAVQVLPGSDLQPIISVYNSFACHYNLMADRTNEQWKTRLEVNPYEKLIYSYVWYDENDRASGYFQYNVGKNETGAQVLNIIEIAWRNHEGLLGMLGFIGHFFVLNNLEKVSLTAAPDFQPEILFPEPRKLEFRYILLGMSRVINAQRAFERMKKPTSSGKAIIRIVDETAPWNANTWQICWEDGGCEVSLTSQTPNMTCSVQALAQLVNGYLPLEQLAVRPDVEVIGDADIFSQLFPVKKIMVSEFF